MARRKINVIGSVAGIEAASKDTDAPDDIHSDPAETEVAERDSGNENDPSTTEPVAEDGNVHGLQDQSNETAATDNPTNAEVVDEPDNVDVSDDGSDLGLDDPVGAIEAVDADEDEDVQLTDEEIAAAAAELEAENNNTNTSDNDEPRAAGDDTPSPKVNPQSGDTLDSDGSSTDDSGDDSTAATAPVAHSESIKPATNGEGYRNTFVNPKGDVTVMDDETAERFHNDPKFYSYTYDAATGKNVHVDMLRWSDADGRPVGGKVGDNYELDE